MFNFIKKIGVLLIFLFCFSMMNAQTVHIGLHTEKFIDEMYVSPSVGTYKLFCHDTLVCQLEESDIIQIKKLDTFLVVQNLRKPLGYFTDLNLVPDSSSCLMELRLIHPHFDSQLFSGNIKMKASGQKLHLFNGLNLEDYVAAVVEAEGGYSDYPEYYKVQAILVRTYVLKQLNRHTEEGFNLCDRVHCQVYQGMCNDEKIEMAVKQTNKQVISDVNNQLIMAAYHSNSGGQTATLKMYGLMRYLIYDR